MLYPCIDWTKKVTVRAHSIGEPKMKRESSILRTRAEMTVRFFVGVLRSQPWSPDSVSLVDMSSTGSGIWSRFKVSGRNNATRKPKKMNPILILKGINGFMANFSMRYQDTGIAATPPIIYMAWTWKKMDALLASIQFSSMKNQRVQTNLMSSDATSAKIVKSVDFKTAEPPPMNRKALPAQYHSIAM